MIAANGRDSSRMLRWRALIILRPILRLSRQTKSNYESDDDQQLRNDLRFHFRFSGTRLDSYVDNDQRLWFYNERRLIIWPARVKELIAARRERNSCATAPFSNTASDLCDS